LLQKHPVFDNWNSALTAHFAVKSLFLKDLA